MSVVKYIYIAEVMGGQMTDMPQVEAIAGVGLKGDRYADASGEAAPETQITLIQHEHITAFVDSTGLDLPPDAPRRNLVTEGVNLNPLCGKQFRVGEVVLEGIELCEPCASLMKRTYPEVLKFFVHKGGLRARIIKGGQIQVGDAIEICS